MTEKAEKQPEALRLANAIRCNEIGCLCSKNLAADELRRLHAANVELLEALKKCKSALEWVIEQGGGPECEHESGVVCFCKENNALHSADEAIEKHGGTS